VRYAISIFCLLIFSLAANAFAQTSNSSAAFLGTDTTTQGNWQGKYGADGYFIGNTNYQSIPGYAVFTPENELGFTWASTTADPRALVIPGGSGGIASCWYNNPTFSFDINITDGNSHQIALYTLDWDSGGRTETIQIVDANNPNSVLSTQSISGFSGGIYLLWTISGQVKINVTMTAGANAVVSGIFFGIASPPAAAQLRITTSSLAVGQQGTAYSTTLTAMGGVAPYTWTLTSGSLPGGLTLNSLTGLIGGIPTALVNASSLAFEVADSTTPTAQTDTATFDIWIVSATGYSVLLSWNASSSPVITGYNVYRSDTSGSGYAKINSTPVFGLNYADSTVVSGQTYYYVTTAVDPSGYESSFSNEIQEVVP